MFLKPQAAKMDRSCMVSEGSLLEGNQQMNQGNRWLDRMNVDFKMVEISEKPDDTMNHAR